MPNFRLSLNNNLPARVPSNQQVIFTFPGGPQAWWVQPLNPNPLQNTGVPEVTCAADLANQPTAQSRTLRMHYATAPNTEDHQISSVIKVG